MTSETWYQQCDCTRTSASGPRIVPVEETWDGSKQRLKMALVKLACDECNRPWTKDPKPGWRLTEFTNVGFFSPMIEYLRHASAGELIFWIILIAVGIWQAVEAWKGKSWDRPDR